MARRHVRPDGREYAPLSAREWALLIWRGLGMICLVALLAIGPALFTLLVLAEWT